MIPYLHLGPLTIPTFGLMVATALIVSAYILQADFNRRGMNADAFLMITIAGLAGIAGAKLYHLLEDPSVFFADPWPLLFSRYGFAWFGSLIAGFFTMLFLGWRAKLPLWQFLDACSPAASFGYGIGRIGCFLSGDGDYGRPTNLPWGMSFPNGVVPTTETCVQWGWPANCRVHPAPLYELVIWCVIGALLWRLGGKWMKKPGAGGWLFGVYLILTGLARFLVEIIRINPRTILGMSNAQVASLVSVVAGVVLLVFLMRRAGPDQQNRAMARKRSSAAS
jgi:phosphatidylglycerol---prolipoprotein diacylglyceryl transferase